MSAYDGSAGPYVERIRDEKKPLMDAAYAMLCHMLGPGDRRILDIGCGTGGAVEHVRGLGYEPFGIDLSLDMLQEARRTAPLLQVFQGDATQLPVASDRVQLAYSTFALSSIADLDAAAHEIHRILVPAGRYVSVCLHPCFYSGLPRRQKDGTVLVYKDYSSTEYLPPDRFTSGIRSEVGQYHRPLDKTITAFLDVGFHLIGVMEGGPDSVPSLLGIDLVKPPLSSQTGEHPGQRDHSETQVRAVLVCPEDRGSLNWADDEQLVYNPRLQRAYPINEGIPQLVTSAAINGT